MSTLPQGLTSGEPPSRTGASGWSLRDVGFAVAIAVHGPLDVITTGIAWHLGLFVELEGNPLVLALGFEVSVLIKALALAALLPTYWWVRGDARLSRWHEATLSGAVAVLVVTAVLISFNVPILLMEVMG